MIKQARIWWVSDGNRSIGSWETKEEAESFIDSGLLPTNDGYKWFPEAHEVITCPVCNKPAERDIVNGLGECLRCNHVRGDFISAISDQCLGEHE
jgi:hypothetical protein